jgi:hypothetical protein
LVCLFIIFFGGKNFFEFDWFGQFLEFFPGGKFFDKPQNVFNKVFLVALFYEKKLGGKFF